MTNLQTCLAAFAVSSWANDEAGRERADQAIDAYLANFAQADHGSALKALKVAFLELHLDSAVAIEIAQHIEGRLAYLPRGHRFRGLEDDCSIDA